MAKSTNFALERLTARISNLVIEAYAMGKQDSTYSLNTRGRAVSSFVSGIDFV